MTNDKDITDGVLIPAPAGGRPTKYDDKYVELLIELMALGYTNEGICAEWGISHGTFYNWRNDHPKLKEAYERGLPQSETWWENIGKAGMMGQIPKFNATMWLAFMNRKFKWADRESTNEPKTQINIGQLQVLQNTQQLTNEQLDDKIHTLMTNLRIENDGEDCRRSEEGTDDSSSGETDPTKV